MKRAVQLVLVLALVVAACGCQSNKRQAADPDYRREQADRQTQRDAQSPKKQSQRPIDQDQQKRQDVIDQPR